jgi:hypothetical protein
MLRGRMFPNVRLLFGALFASVVALSCGFGLFATFRVNHEPLSRLPAGTAPVQFVANEVAGPRAGWGTPFDGQSRLNGPQRGEIAADAPAETPAGQSSLESTSTGTAAAIKPVAAATPAIETAAPSAIAQPAVVIEPAVTATTAVAAVPSPPVSESAPQISGAAPASGAAKQTAPAAAASTAVVTPADSAAHSASVAPDQTASVPSPSTDVPAASASVNLPADTDPAQATGAIVAAPPTPEQSANVPVSAASSAPAVTVPPSQKPAAETEAATPVSAAKQDSDPGAAVKAAAPVIATQTPVDQPSVAPPPADQAEPSSKAVTAPAKAAVKPVRNVGAKKDGKITRKPVARRRVAVKRRIVRRVRRTPGQNAGFGDPVFQSAPNYSGASASRTGANSTGW